MNIIEELSFNEDRSTSKAIRRSDGINYIAFGLLHGQRLSNHKTPIPTTLTMMMGCVDFVIEDDVIRLEQFDTYDIPVGIQHAVVGVDEKSVFTLIQEK